MQLGCLLLLLDDDDNNPPFTTTKCAVSFFKKWHTPEVGQVKSMQDIPRLKPLKDRLKFCPLNCCCCCCCCSNFCADSTPAKAMKKKKKKDTVN